MVGEDTNQGTKTKATNNKRPAIPLLRGGPIFHRDGVVLKAETIKNKNLGALWFLKW